MYHLLIRIDGYVIKQNQQITNSTKCKEPDDRIDSNTIHIYCLLAAYSISLNAWQFGHWYTASEAIWLWETFWAIMLSHLPQI